MNGHGEIRCWSCDQEIELSPQPEDGDKIRCVCGATCVIQVTKQGEVLPRTMSEDEDYESRCDSQASREYEERAYGPRDED